MNIDECTDKEEKLENQKKKKDSKALSSKAKGKEKEVTNLQQHRQDHGFRSPQKG